MRFEFSLPELRDRPDRHGELRLQRLNFRGSTYVLRNMEAVEIKRDRKP